MDEFRYFMKWLFDGKLDSEIPNKEVLLKYNSPISHTYLISLFLKNGSLNNYLNKYFNNFNIRKIDKEELFIFIKKCVKDFKININTIYYSSYRRRKKLFDIVRKKIPLLKDYEIEFLCNEIIDKHENKDQIYSSLGLEINIKQKKSKIKKEQKNKKISLDDFLSENFKIMTTHSLNTKNGLS